MHITSEIWSLNALCTLKPDMNNTKLIKNKQSTFLMQFFFYLLQQKKKKHKKKEKHRYSWV